MRRLHFLLAAICLASSLLLGQATPAGAPAKMPGLIDSAAIIRDTNNIAHIRATNEHDLAFLQGYTHAQDRFFQMDYLRHVAGGTFAEMVGPAALPLDVQMRTLGFKRAAVRSVPTVSPRLQTMLQAYADGVNAYLGTHALPPEYQALGIATVDNWELLDTLAVTKLLTFKMTFNATDLEHTAALASYQAVGKVAGFDGTKLFFEDLFRPAPFENTVTLSGSTMGTFEYKRAHHSEIQELNPDDAEMTRHYLKALEGLEFFKRLKNADTSGGSNGWVVAGSFTESGAPVIANDPHVGLDYPAIWYPIHLSAGNLDVTGNSFPGTPLVVLGHNRWISWGTTSAGPDVIDYFSEQLMPDGSSPTGLSTLYKGTLEHVIPIRQSYRARVGGQLVTLPPTPGIPQVTLVVPRRNNGPIVDFNSTTGKAISMQWTGFSATTELEAVLTWAEARTPDEFEKGVRQFTMPQNFFYIDRSGNIGYYLSGEIPLREDLQAGFIAGAPPNVVRNGQGGNEWLPVSNRHPYQTLAYEIIPPSEMPKALNPPSGFIVNANNDLLGLTLDNAPLSKMRPGGGIYFISHQFNLGLRAARITELLSTKLERSEKITPQDMQRIQADTVLVDARFFVPYISRALENAKRVGAPVQMAVLASDPALGEAVGRLSSWNFSSPSGLTEGYDAFDSEGQANQRSTSEIASSVATTIYTLWRSQFIQSVIDAKLMPYKLPVPDGARPLTALRNLLENFDTRKGIGASGIDFFAAAGIANAADRRDLYILQSLKSALNLLASDSFKTAFVNSTNQNDYRWGKLNRLLLSHPLGPNFSVPSAGGMYPSPLPGLLGLPVDGAYQTVDPSSDSLRGNDENGFVFHFGASERSIAEALPSGVRGSSSLPGGVSAVMTSADYFNLLPQQLRNGVYEQFFRMNEIQGAMNTVTKYEP